MGKHPDPANSNDKASVERARKRGQSMFRSTLLAFAGGSAALAVVAFIATGEIAAVLLVVFGFLGIAVFGWLGQRWVLRNIDGG